MSETRSTWRPDAADLGAAIDVWHLRLTPTEARTDHLTPDEILRSTRFRIDKPRTQFVAARAQLRRILASYVDVAPEALRFDYGEHGKPRLAGQTANAAGDLEFNLSHSGEAGLLGVTRGVPIGVDVEVEKPVRRFEGIAQRFFAPPESAALMRLAEPARPAAFYRAWVCKEAYLKAWGTGLTFSSRRFTIRYVDAHPPTLIDTEMPSDTAGDWKFRTFPTFAGHAAALCYPSGQDYPSGQRWLRHFMPSALTCSAEAPR